MKESSVTLDPWLVWHPLSLALHALMLSRNYGLSVTLGGLLEVIRSSELTSADRQGGLLDSIIYTPRYKPFSTDVNLATPLGAKSRGDRFEIGFHLLQKLAEEGVVKIAVPDFVSSRINQTGGRRPYWAANLLHYFPESTRIIVPGNKLPSRSQHEAASNLLASITSLAADRLRVPETRIKEVQPLVLAASRRLPHRHLFADKETLDLIEGYEETLNLYRENLELVQLGYLISTGDPILGRAAASLTTNERVDFETDGELRCVATAMNRYPGRFTGAHVLEALQADSLPRELGAIDELEHQINKSVALRDLGKQGLSLVLGLVPGVSYLVAFLTAVGLIREARAVRREFRGEGDQALLYHELQEVERYARRDD